MRGGELQQAAAESISGQAARCCTKCCCLAGASAAVRRACSYLGRMDVQLSYRSRERRMRIGRCTQLCGVQSALCNQMRATVGMRQCTVIYCQARQPLFGAAPRLFGAGNESFAQRPTVQSTVLSLHKPTRDSPHSSRENVRHLGWGFSAPHTSQSAWASSHLHRLLAAQTKTPLLCDQRCHDDACGSARSGQQRGHASPLPRMIC